MEIRTVVVYAFFALVGSSVVALLVGLFLSRGTLADERIADLIAKNAARSRDGMGRVDRDLVNLAGKRRSDEAFAAQENCRQAERLNHRIESRREKVRAFPRGINRG